MKTFKDIYKFPLKTPNRGGWVYDQKGNFVFEFETKFDEKGNFAQGWKEFEQKVINRLNSLTSSVNITNVNFVHENGQIYLMKDNKKTHIITIRGWGNLTGIGGHNLSAGEASTIQDTFAEFVVEKLNSNDESNKNT